MTAPRWWCRECQQKSWICVYYHRYNAKAKEVWSWHQSATKVPLRWYHRLAALWKFWR